MQIWAGIAEIHIQKVRNLGAYIFNKYKVKDCKSLSITVLLFTRCPGIIFNNTHFYSQCTHLNHKLWSAEV